MKCPDCQQDNPDRMRFCVECGVDLAVDCPECGAEMRTAYKFCGECGTSLRDGKVTARPRPAPARKPAGAAAAGVPAAGVPAAGGEGERKQATVLFCELAATAVDGEAIAPDLLHTLLARFSELGRAEVERYGGTVQRFLGQGFMALFGAPVAQEEHPHRAVLAATALGERLGEQLGDVEGRYGVRWSARVGIDTGPVVVSADGAMAVGEATTVAGHLQQIARPGTVLLSERTARWVSGRLEVELEADAGEEVYRVVRTDTSGAGYSGGLSVAGLRPLVGREHELATLEELREQASRGHGQVVGLCGEAGLGKSRLLHEFFRRTFPGRRVSYLRGRCLSYGGGVPCLPLVDMIRKASRVAAADAPAAVAQKLRASLKAVGTDPAAALPYFLRLMGVREGTEALDDLEPQAIQSRTFAAMRRMLLDASRNALVVMEVEDVHWIDDTSEEMLASLVEVLGGARLMLLMTYRPGYQPRWLEKSYATQIPLRRLSEDESRRLASGVLGSDDARLGGLLAKAEGNPLFLEELARALAESDGSAPVPDTIQGILSTRIDRLPDAHKQLLKTASVLGREFSIDLLEALWDGGGDAAELLEDLRAWEIVYKTPSEEETRHYFKHALTQEVAYESLLAHRRRELHRRAAEVLEATWADRLEDVYDQLIYHTPRAGEPDKTVRYLALFADKAARGYAHAEAAKALREALVHAEELDEEVRDRRATEILLHLAESLLPLASFPETLELCERHAERVARLEDPSLEAQLRFWLAHTHTYLGNQEATRENARASIEAARTCGDETTEGKANYVLGRDGFWSGAFRDGIEASLRAVVLLERSGEPWWQGQAYWVAGFNHYVLGELEKGIDALERTCSIGEALEDYRLDASWSMGYFYACLGETEEGVEQCRRGVEGAQDPLNTAVALGFLGYARLQAARAADGVGLEEALQTLRDSVERLRPTGMLQILGWFSVFLGEAYLARGELDEAREVTGQGLAWCEDSRFRYGVALARHTLGRIAAAAGEEESAAAGLAEALEAFRTLEVPFEAARVHLDLARLARAGGDGEAAVRELGEARRVFEELHVPRYVERAAALAEAWVRT